jgi:hypothetical protein
VAAGLYAWIVSTFFGAILVDVVYSHIASSDLAPSETRTIFSQVADFLLFVSALALLAGIGAIASSWSLASARNVFIASLLFVMLEFMTPMLFFSLLQNAQVNLGLDLGMWIRLIGSALSSILAFVGLWKLCPCTS